jgi:hypothetical protein
MRHLEQVLEVGGVVRHHDEHGLRRRRPRLSASPLCLAKGVRRAPFAETEDGRAKEAQGSFQQSQRLSVSLCVEGCLVEYERVHRKPEENCPGGAPWPRRWWGQRSRAVFPSLSTV